MEYRVRGYEEWGAVVINDETGKVIDQRVGVIGEIWAFIMNEWNDEALCRYRASICFGRTE